MTTEELRRIGIALFGPHSWQTALAAELQISPRTLRRWVAGEGAVTARDVPPAQGERILAIAQRRLRALRMAVGDLEVRLQGDGTKKAPERLRSGAS